MSGAGDKVALVTGAAGGLGQVMAQALLADGFRLVAAGTGHAKLAAAFAGHAPERCRLVVADLEEPAAPERLAADALAAFGRIDILVNNAGVSTSAMEEFPPDRPVPFLSIPTPMLERFYRLNTLAPLRLTAALLPQMRARRFGRIVNVSTGLATMLTFGGYGGSKAALEAETACLAAELAGSGVTANMLLPGGATASHMTRNFAPDVLLPATIMSGPIRWLASHASSAMNGSRIRARYWDDALPLSQAAAIAEPIAWSALAEAQKHPPNGA